MSSARHKELGSGSFLGDLVYDQVVPEKHFPRDTGSEAGAGDHDDAGGVGEEVESSRGEQVSPNRSGNLYDRPG